MAGYDTVPSPGGMSYGAPLVDFGAIGDLANTFMQGRANYFQNRSNQRQDALANAFPNGIPLNSQGQPDYGAMMQILAQKGGIDQAIRLAPTQADAAQRAQPSQLSPLLAGASAAPQTAGPSPAAAAPQSAPMSLPAPPANSAPGGGDQPGSVVDIVTSALPQDSAATGSVISNIARAVGVDPNAALTPQQSARVTQLVGSYARRTGVSPQPAASPAATAPQSPSARIAATFATPGPAQDAAPMTAPQASPVAAPQAAPAPPAAAPSQPIIPQVPLPVDPRTGRPFTDPQQAIQALRIEAARVAGDNNPYHARSVEYQVKELNDWATRIENSVAPIKVGPYETIVDSRTGQPLLRGAMAQNQGSLSGPALEGAAQRYFQTGQFPSGMTRDTPSNRADRANIQQKAYEIADQQGITPDQLPAMWQTFSTRAAGLRTFEQRAAGLTLAESEAKRLIPRVHDISSKVSKTEYPTINALILAAKKGTGDPNVVRLGIAVESLVPVYARVLKPVGQIGQADMERAHDILDKAWSQGQIDAALDQMQIELQSAKEALQDARQEYGGTAPRGGPKSAPAPRSDQPSAPPAAAIAALKQHPDRAAEFDEYYGAGSAARALGQ